MTSRKTIFISMVIALSCFSIALAKKSKVPFKVLYSNDTTNVVTCVSPRHGKRLGFTPQVLEDTVDETANVGIEVHMLQPGMGWIPWWQSKVCPDAQRWYRDEAKSKLSGYDRYVLAGGDIVDVFVKRCKKNGLVAFISYRLNDGHGRMVNKPGEPFKWSGDEMGKFYHDHPEYRIGANSRSWFQRVHNWAIPEVRAYKFALIEEIIENYDIDGFELDFLRHCSFFPLDKTTSQQRKNVMAGFIAKVRKALDENSRPGQKKWLCVRIPSHLDSHDALGVDVKRFVKAGVDMLNLSGFYFTEQQTDLDQITKAVPDTPVYLEMTQTIMTGRSIVKNAYDSYTFRRTTPNQFYTAAHIAYTQGAAGVSTFNFAYYREHGSPGRGPFNDPPFHIFNHIGDKEWVAKQSQHYVLCDIWNIPPLKSRQMPRMFKKGTTHKFKLFMAEPPGGWTENGKLRIESDKLLDGSKWTVIFNNVPLESMKDRSEPYITPYRNLLGKEEQYRAFVLPYVIVKNGYNNIKVIMIDGNKDHKIIFMDVALK